MTRYYLEMVVQYALEECMPVGELSNFLDLILE